MRFPTPLCTPIVYLVLSLITSACASPAPAASTSTFPRVTVPNSELRTLHSAATGRDYNIYVHLPDAYAQHPAERYPVLYVLDGQWDFKLLESIHGGLLYDRFVPELIIVGVTYTGDNPDYGALRAMDYTPTAVPDIPGSGDAPKFLAFFKEALIPFIETNYQTDPSQRILMGSSFAGLFTLYAMFAEPGLFSGYVAGSPSVPYGSRFTFKQEAEYARNHTDLPVRLFVSVGELEDLAQPVNEFAQIVAGRGYTGLKMERRVIAGERHAGNKPESFNRGLRFMFASE